MSCQPSFEAVDEVEGKKLNNPGKEGAKGDSVPVKYIFLVLNVFFFTYYL